MYLHTTMSVLQNAFHAIAMRYDVDRCLEECPFTFSIIYIFLYFVGSYASKNTVWKCWPAQFIAISILGPSEMMDCQCDT